MNIVAIANNTVPSANNFTPSFPVQRTTVLEANVVNPNFLRTFTLSQDVLKITQGNTQVGYKTSDLLNTAVALYPALTWPPIFTTNPVNSAPSNNTDPTSFFVVVSSEVSVNYQWYSSNDSGVSWVSMSNSGAISNVTTNHLNISNVFAFSNHTLWPAAWFKVNANSVAGNTNSRYATLTVT